MKNILVYYQPVLDSVIKKMRYSDLFTLNKVINLDRYSLTQMTEKGLHEIKYFIFILTKEPLIFSSTLFLQHKQLAYLPKSIGLLKHLKHLYLHNNKLREIPEGIFSLENLIVLDLGRNIITEIPETIIQLRKLIELDLSYNYLTIIPKFISQLNLKSLEITGNNIDCKLLT